MNTTNARDFKTANDAYQAKSKNVRALLVDLEARLAKLDARQADQSRDWGYVGSIGSIEQQLIEIIEQLKA